MSLCLRDCPSLSLSLSFSLSLSALTKLLVNGETEFVRERHLIIDEQISKIIITNCPFRFNPWP